MTRILVVLAGLFWAAVLFLVVGYITFPGDAIAERVEYEVAEGSRGAYALDLGDVSPWWIGLSTDSIKVYTREGRSGPASKLMMLATQGQMAAGLTSLMWRQPRVSGSVTLGTNGELDYVVGTSMNEDGDELLLTEVQLDSDSFPIAELLAFVPGSQINGTGNLDIDVKVVAPEGLSKSDGRIEISGTTLKLIEPVVMDFPLGRDVLLDDIDIVFDIDEGTAKIKKGRINTDVANIELSGSIMLKDNPDASNMDVRIAVELDESMSMVKQMFASAEKDGKLMYRCTGPMSRIERACRADTGKKVSKGRTTRAKPVTKGATPETTTDRKQRRKELQERLKRRREQREKERGGGARRPGSGDPKDAAKDEELDDEELDDEELEDEELEDEELLLDEDPVEEEFFDE